MARFRRGFASYDFLAMCQWRACSTNYSKQYIGMTGNFSSK